METVGKINSSYNEHNVEWLIQNFIPLFAEDCKVYESPTFSFKDIIWCLRIEQDGGVHFPFFYNIYLCKIAGSEINIDFSLSIKGSDGTRQKEGRFRHNFEEGDFVTPSITLRNELLKRKSKLLPNDAFTIICAMKYTESSEHIADGSLSEDFKKMLQDGINHDLILKVDGKEIKAHKDILRARCEVFKSMLEHDMKEKNTGIVNVSDCDPEAMEVFLSYVYSGKVDTINQNNILKLYYIADKYQMIVLKCKCCSFFKQSISPTNFCDVIQLALNHSDSELLNFATEYFCNNVLDVLQTVEWQSFFKDNFTVANELIIKSHEIKK